MIKAPGFIILVCLFLFIFEIFHNKKLSRQEGLRSTASQLIRPHTRTLALPV